MRILVYNSFGCLYKAILHNRQLKRVWNIALWAANAPSRDTFLSMPTTQPAHVVLVLQESALLAGSSGHGKAVYGNPYSTLGLAFRPQKERRVCQGSDQHTACTVYFKCLGCVNKEGIETKRTRPPEEWFSYTIFRKPCKIISIVLKSAQRNALISLWRWYVHLSGVCQTVAANNRLCYGSIFYSLLAFEHSLPQFYPKCKCRIYKNPYFPLLSYTYFS